MTEPDLTRPHGRLGAELTGYRDEDHGRRKPRVDIVDRDRVTVLATLSPSAALDLCEEILTAAMRARTDNGNPPTDVGPEPASGPDWPRQARPHN